MTDSGKGIFQNLCKKTVSDIFFTEKQLNLYTNKAIAKKWVNTFGINVARQLKLFSKLEKIKLLPGTVLKPSFETLSKGVFLVHTENLILDFTSGKLLHGFEDLYKNANDYIQKKIVHNDLWNLEEMVQGRLFPFPPHEIKCFCFYGKIGMILEKQVARKGDYFEFLISFYKENGDKIYFHDDSKDRIKGIFTEALFDKAKKISLSLPLAFIRIDFLINKDNDFVFSEFELVSGLLNIIPLKIYQKLDVQLATFYKDAEKRLAEDLKCGKKFIETNELIKSMILK